MGVAAAAALLPAASTAVVEMEQAALRALREAAGSSAAGAAGGSAALCSGRSAAETKFAALRALQVAALLPAASVSLLPTAPNCFPQRRGRLEALPPYAIVEMAPKNKQDLLRINVQILITYKRNLIERMSMRSVQSKIYSKGK